MQPRNAIYDYITTQPAPGSGVGAPRLQQGNAYSVAGTSYDANLPGYVSVPVPTVTETVYAPPDVEDRTISVPVYTDGADGWDVLRPTQHPHVVARVRWFNANGRSAPAWADSNFPASTRPLQGYTPPTKYATYNAGISARPLPRSDFFAGFTQSPDVAAQIGGSGVPTLGG